MLFFNSSKIPENKLSFPFLPVDLVHDLIFSRGLYIYTDAPISGYFFSEHMFHRETFSHAGTYPVAGTDHPGIVLFENGCDFFPEIFLSTPTAQKERYLSGVQPQAPTSDAV